MNSIKHKKTFMKPLKLRIKGLCAQAFQNFLVICVPYPCSVEALVAMNGQGVTRCPKKLVCGNDTLSDSLIWHLVVIEEVTELTVSATQRAFTKNKFCETKNGKLENDLAQRSKSHIYF